jgi:hypothetical protein
LPLPFPVPPPAACAGGAAPLAAGAAPEPEGPAPSPPPAVGGGSWTYGLGRRARERGHQTACEGRLPTHYPAGSHPARRAPAHAALPDVVPLAHVEHAVAVGPHVQPLPVLQQHVQQCGELQRALLALPLAGAAAGAKAVKAGAAAGQEGALKSGGPQRRSWRTTGPELP